MVQAAQDRRRADRPLAWDLSLRRWLRRGLGDPLVRPVPVEVGHVLAEDPGEVALAEDEQVVQAFAADAPQEALAHRCAGYVRRFTRSSIPRAAGRSSEEHDFWVTHLTWRRKPKGTAAWWESENGQKMRMAGAREARAIR